MTVKILYFASLKEALGCTEESFVLPSGVSTVGELRAFLAERGEKWKALGEGRNVRAARNQRMAAPADPVLPGDEIAFFPPVTGG
ncbi:molybdopterin converting factor subunit 1 [Aromatoleum petrolei]|uniref:Molybdopterin synthase sulfur carrier subunit n=1 Tax=Aromatoleum petrolei TaxID=76116 RepID=A0ABX1MP14_9RHOO|nr:molybdopterin converting factor subunit 1 [Aromatoleum petrolei]NMF88080.1 molybdopterin converting factor subunit 1 [Aromatoleum petrolei]QTQ38865.1 Molybdopterin synthase, sulfur carrier subunit [Aromatoleum petrolei]